MIKNSLNCVLICFFVLTGYVIFNKSLDIFIKYDRVIRLFSIIIFFTLPFIFVKLNKNIKQKIDNLKMFD